MPRSTCISYSLPQAPPPASGVADRQGIGTAAAAATKGQKQVRLSPPQPPQQQRQAAVQLPAQQQQQLWSEQQQSVQLEAADRSRTAAGSQPASAVNPGHVASKPSDTWRRGEATGFPSPTRNTQNPLRRSLGASCYMCVTPFASSMSKHLPMFNNTRHAINTPHKLLLCVCGS
jgi:hypothetical protein